MDGLRPPVFLFQGATDDGAIGGNSPLFHRDSLSTFLSIIFPFLCNLWSELKPPRGQWCLALGSDPLLFISNASRYNSFAKMAAFKTYLQQHIWVESSSFLYFSPWYCFLSMKFGSWLAGAQEKVQNLQETVLDAWGKSEKNEMNFSKEISMGSLQVLHFLEAHILNVICPERFSPSK